jgi:hypothetical protein
MPRKTPQPQSRPHNQKTICSPIASRLRKKFGSDSLKFVAAYSVGILPLSRDGTKQIRGERDKFCQYSQFIILRIRPHTMRGVSGTTFTASSLRSAAPYSIVAIRPTHT